MSDIHPYLASLQSWCRHMHNANYPFLALHQCVYSHASLTVSTHSIYFSLLIALQVIGVPPNVASAEALMQACWSVTYVAGRVNQLIALFQPALAAAQLIQTFLPPELRFTDPALAAPQMLPQGTAFSTVFIDAAQSVLVGQPACLPASSMTHAGARWQAESEAAFEQRSHDQLSEAGPDLTQPGKDMLPAGLASGS